MRGIYRSPAGRLVLPGIVMLLALLTACAPGPQPAPTAAAPKAETGQTPAREAPAPSKSLPRTVSIGTNPAGTGAHSIASALAKVASTHTPITVKVVPASGPNAWITQLDQGEIEFGIMNTVDSWMAYNGKGEYAKAYKKLRVVSGGVYPFTAGIIVRKDSDIRTITDLRGKRVTSDFGGHAVNQVLFDATLATAGLTLADMRPVPVPSVTDAVRALVEGRVDAAFTGLGIGVVEEANAAIGVRIVAVPNTAEARAAVDRVAPGVGIVVERAGTVTGALEDTPVIGYPLQLVGSADVPEEAVYTLMKVWWEKEDELRPIHPLMQRWTHETVAIKNFTVPYHPGTMKLLQEVKAWTPEMEALHRKLLAQ